MGFVNKVMLLGNLTRDPERRDLPSGSVVCDFGLATNRVYKTSGGEEREETAFIDCTVFGRMAEVIAEYAKKGRPLFVEGRLHFESWQDQQGNRRNKLSVIVENFQFVGGRESEGEARSDGVQAARQAELPPLIPERAPAKGATSRKPENSRQRANERFQGGQAPAGTARSFDRSKPRNAAATRDVDRMAEQAQQAEILEADLPF